VFDRQVEERRGRSGVAEGWGKIAKQVKALDGDDLVRLVRDLYNASPENRRFLKGRFLQDASDLEDYRKRVAGAVFPDPLGTKPVRIGEAERLVRHFRQATGDHVGATDLFLTVVEEGTEQAADLGYGDDKYFGSLLRILRQVVEAVPTLPRGVRPAFEVRLRKVADRACQIGWGYGDGVRELVDAGRASGRTSGCS
jgi:hypothetical protein